MVLWGIIGSYQAKADHPQKKESDMLFKSWDNALETSNLTQIRNLKNDSITADHSKPTIRH